MFGPIGMNGSGIRARSAGSIARGRRCPPAVPTAHRPQGQRIGGAAAGAAMRALPSIASSKPIAGCEPGLQRGSQPRRRPTVKCRRDGHVRFGALLLQWRGCAVQFISYQSSRGSSSDAFRTPAFLGCGFSVVGCADPFVPSSSPVLRAGSAPPWPKPLPLHKRYWACSGAIAAGWGRLPMPARRGEPR